ncbi:Torsin-1A [Platysternon megacephalum]|uniref:Torsin-1A n=1 Tax=Platysternon megacephalum TaxID=55544 RepID=A0A4D9EAS0_9SAUR|nr:Torsin-1A [Platysternon megacephalum]
MKLLNMAGFFTLVPTLVSALEPITTSLAFCGAAVMWQLFSPASWLKCRFLECCNMKDTLDIPALQMALEQKVFGQHLATQVVLKALSAYSRDKQPRKPLVMSFHGWTGTGKSFVSKIIARNLYQRHEARRRFVHQYDAVLHFPHAEHIKKYKEQLQNWIRGNVSVCPRSLFIFSEMDQMPHGLIDSIMPYLSDREAINGVYYGKAIFLFLNNAGGDKITEVALDHWRRQKGREEIPLTDLQSMLSAEIFNNRNSEYF